MNTNNDTAFFDYPTIHMFPPYDVTSEFMVLMAVTTNPALKIQNKIPRLNTQFLENIIGVKINPSSDYRITKLYKFHWFCKDQPTCIETLSLVRWYSLMKGSNADHNLFFKYFGNSFDYQKNFHRWLVGIGYHRIVTFVPNWDAIGKFSLRQVREMCTRTDFSKNIFVVELKIVIEMMLRFNFTPVATVSVPSDKLQVIVPLVVLSEVLGISWGTGRRWVIVPSSDLSFIYFYSTRTHPLHILQIFKPFSATVWAMFVLITGLLSLLNKERKQFRIERFLAILTILINQVPRLHLNNKLLFLWVLLTTVTTTMYLSFYESCLVSPEHPTLKTFNELSQNNYRLLIGNSSTYVHWVVYNNYSPFKGTEYLRKLRDTAISFESQTVTEATEYILTKNKMVALLETPSVSGAAQVLSLYYARRGFKCVGSEEALKVYQYFWSFSGPSTGVLQTKFQQMVDFGIIELFLVTYFKIYAQYRSESDFALAVNLTNSMLDLPLQKNFQDEYQVFFIVIGGG
ncbi:unnamed protein product [Allacma fusca]|uniref:Uncharacterized protein n=1 Tax=Allacma fusca TaxID=39272 RepID=A0A8J2J9D1_9HEXA|nr:unnamed protein product [Allacma fusca]